MVIGDGVKQSCLRNSIQLAKRQCQNQQVTRQLLLTLSPFTLAEWTVPLKHFPTDFKLQNGPGPQTVPALFSHFFFRERQEASWAPFHPVSKYLFSGKQTNKNAVVTNYHDSTTKLPVDSQSQHSDSHHSCLLVSLFAPPLNWRGSWWVVEIMGFKVRIGQKFWLCYCKVLTGTELCWAEKCPHP